MSLSWDTPRERPLRIKRKAFWKIVKSLPRPHPDPQLEWHLQLYDQYTRLKRRLEKLWNVPLLADSDLKALNVVRGAEFNVDESDPLDMEPRFFVPQAASLAEQRAQLFLKRGEKWPQPICDDEYYYSAGRRLPESSCVGRYCDAVWGLVEWEEYIPHLRRVDVMGGNPYWSNDALFTIYNSPLRIADCWQRWIPSRGEYHSFGVCGLYHSIKQPDSIKQDPAVPHVMMGLSDSIIPDDRILRSELLMAAVFLRSRLATCGWPRHHTFPMLVLSFHEGGARILQVHAVNGQLHVRVSRRLNLLSDENSVPADAKILFRWIFAKPIGHTHFSNIPRSLTTKEEGYYQNRDPGASSMLKIETMAEIDVQRVPSDAMATSHDERICFIIS